MRAAVCHRRPATYHGARGSRRGADPARVERTAYLLSAVAEAAVAVVTAVDRFQGFVADRQRPEVGDDETPRSPGRDLFT